MPDPNTNATGGDNTQGSGINAGTATGENNNSAGTNAGTQNGGENNTEGNASGKIAFTPEQQSFINNLVKTESDKAIGKAKTKWESDAKLSEDERTKKELEETKAALLERDTRDYVSAQAEKAGVKNPKLFYNAYKSELEFDEKGKVTNLKDVLAAAKTESPELFQAQQKQQGSADGGSGKQTAATLTKEMIEKMTPAEVAANMSEIDKFLAAQK